jgi:2-polyprenyl-3-methyl-5-hydroxy-6-metoxy-1,4-benzoquinol methylase
LKSRVERIRKSERQSHIEIYSNEVLYSSDSWLRKPIKTVQEIVPFFKNIDNIRVLDLGCGVGRNSIFIAEHFSDLNCRIDCVDILDIAIEKLLDNAKEHGVSGNIYGYVDTIENYSIASEAYDLIIAVSSIEHVESKEVFLKKLQEIQEGVRPEGIVCLVVNSNVKEKKKDTFEETEPQFEVNLPTDELQTYIDDVFSKWETIKRMVNYQEYDIPRDGFISRLSTNVVTYVGRK